MRPETQAQAVARLLKVIANAEFEILPGFYVFEAMPGGLAEARADALACVRDSDLWSQLVPEPHPRATQQPFKVLKFRFSPEFDATGFVGWRHTHLFQTTGAPNIVVCGKDRRNDGELGHGRGNIYWGCPARYADAAIAEVRSLIARGHAGDA